MNELDRVLADVTRGLADLSEEVGPVAAEATLKMVKLAGIIDIASGFILVLLAGGLLYTAYFFTRKSREASKSDPYSMWDFTYGLGAAILGLCGLCSGGQGLYMMLAAKNWISAVDPAAGLAYRLLEKL